jgi:dephospho-CoA kinase
LKPYLLGVTGGIATGKSSVSRLLSSYCQVPLVDVDQCCKHLLELHQPGWLALRAELGGSFFMRTGELDRSALRERIFADADFRRQVDAILHPLAREAMRRKVSLCKEPWVLVEIPLLYEAGWQNDVDAVLVVYSRRGAQCCRIMRRDGGTRKMAIQAITAQMNLKEKLKRADFVIDNSGKWSSTQEQVIALGIQLSERFSK